MYMCYAVCVVHVASVWFWFCSGSDAILLCPGRLQRRTPWVCRWLLNHGVFHMWCVL